MLPVDWPSVDNFVSMISRLRALCSLLAAVESSDNELVKCVIHGLRSDVEVQRRVLERAVACELCFCGVLFDGSAL